MGFVGVIPTNLASSYSSIRSQVYWSYTNKHTDRILLLSESSCEGIVSRYARHQARRPKTAFS